MDRVVRDRRGLFSWCVPFDVQAAYDELNPGDDDHRFYAGLTGHRGARRVVDLGCGTGVLAVLLARSGHQVVALDPDPGMLRVARGRPGTELVSWRDGGAEAISTGWADLATMSGHTAQVFTTDDDWLTALRHIHRGLVPRGLLAFETRNPDARAWEGWTRQQTLRVVATAMGPVEFWHETVHVELPLVTYTTTAADLRTGHTDTTRDTLAFRAEAAVRATLTDTGFVVEEVLGSWDGRPVTSTSPELIVIARAT